MRKNLFLYLALACFVGLLAIFVVDGYMGIHDTVSITAGEREQKIEADYWQRQEKFGFAGSDVGVNRGEKVFFRYEVDNLQFSSYMADIEVSIWHNQEKVRDLISQPISIAAFNKREIKWEIDTKELPAIDASPEQTYQFTVIIKRGEIERRIITYINPRPYQAKPAEVVPIPAPVPAIPPR